MAPGAGDVIGVPGDFLKKVFVAGSLGRELIEQGRGVIGLIATDM